MIQMEVKTLDWTGVLIEIKISSDGSFRKDKQMN
jgi:hypothetical protein